MDRRVARALAGSAAASAAVAERADDLRTPAGMAWRWVVRTDALELYATGRATPTTWIAGGGALYRARVALAADGLASRVTLLPDADPAHLATLVALGPIAITAEARERFDATEAVAHDVAPGLTALAADLAAAARAEGTGISVREEAGELIAVLYGPDTQAAWLRAGEALSAVRVEAARHGRLARPTLAGRERAAEKGTWAGAERRRDRDSVVYVHLVVGHDPGSANSR